MKLLTDKCLIEFEKWYVKNYQRRTLNEFWGMPDSNKIGILILYFDSVGICIIIQLFDTFNWQYTIDYHTEETKEQIWFIDFKSREQAWTQAVERADKIRNEQLNK